jgi:hypothetical protein
VVKVFTQRLVKGEIIETPHELEVRPPLEEMTHSEYMVEMDTTLAEVPVEFRSFVRSQADERGSSSGYEEVVSIAKDIVFNLKSAIAAYNKTNGIKHVGHR